AAVAAVYIVVPAGADHPIAVDEPLAADLRVAGGGELSCKSGLRGIRVGVRQGGERNIFRGNDEFRRQRLLSGPERARVLGIAPLHDEIILYALYWETVEIVLAHELFDVGDVARREARRELDDHSACRQLHVKRVLRIEGAPIARLR